MATVTKSARIGLDIAKTVFQAHGVDERERPNLRKRLKRAEVLSYFAKVPPCEIGMEACGGAHYWARELAKLGHTVKLMAPHYVKPYRTRGKNDANDAEAICEAMSRPGMRFVPIKSAESQAELMPLGVRNLLIKQRTAVINTIRDYAAEFGVIATKGPVKVAELLQQAHAEEANVPALALDMLRLLAAQLDALDIKLKLIENRLMALHRENPVSQCLASQPGIGPIGAVSFALSV